MNISAQTQRPSSAVEYKKLAKTYRDENETKMNISAQTQRPSSAVEYKKLAKEGLCVWAEIFIFVSFHLFMSQRCSPAGWTMLSSVLGKCHSVPLPFLFVSCISRLSLLYYTYVNIKILFHEQINNLYVHDTHVFLYEQLF